jgi:2-dehydro-3-deoxyphosphogluconate aldolase/(4S)-4-hydroxy-2-oxoglutarate aldolase
MEWVQGRRIIAIVRGQEPENILRLAEALWKGGVDLVEVTFNQAKPETWKDTAAAIHAIATRMEGRVLPGAGTVLSREQLRMAADAGARYIITPNTEPELIGQVKEMGLLSFPGAMTPSEILSAYRAGADAVKVFPAGDLGPAYIKSIAAPLNHIPLMAVGGVDAGNAAKFLAAGCIGIGVGGNLVRKDWIAAGEWDKITATAREYRKAVEEA